MSPVSGGARLSLPLKSISQVVLHREGSPAEEALSCERRHAHHAIPTHKSNDHFRTGSHFSISDPGCGFSSWASLILCKDSSIGGSWETAPAGFKHMPKFIYHKQNLSYCYCHHSNKIEVTSINKVPHKAKAGS